MLVFICTVHRWTVKASGLRKLSRTHGRSVWELRFGLRSWNLDHGKAGVEKVIAEGRPVSLLRFLLLTASIRVSCSASNLEGKAMRSGLSSLD